MPVETLIMHSTAECEIIFDLTKLSLLRGHRSTKHKSSGLTEVQADIGVTHLFLPLDDVRQLCVGDSGIELTFHQRGSFVILNVAEVATLWHFDVFGEALGLNVR